MGPRAPTATSSTSRFQVNVSVPMQPSVLLPKPTPGQLAMQKTARLEKAEAVALRSSTFNPDEAYQFIRSAGRQRGATQLRNKTAKVPVVTSLTSAERPQSPSAHSASRRGSLSARASVGRAALPSRRDPITSDIGRLCSMMHSAQSCSLDEPPVSSARVSCSMTPAEWTSKTSRGTYLPTTDEKCCVVGEDGIDSYAALGDEPPLPAYLPQDAQRARVNTSCRSCMEAGSGLHGELGARTEVSREPAIWWRETSIRRDAAMRGVAISAPTSRASSARSASNRAIDRCVCQNDSNTTTQMTPRQSFAADLPSASSTASGFRSDTLRFTLAVAEELDGAERAANGRPTAEVARACIRLLREMASVVSPDVEPIIHRLTVALSRCIFSHKADAMSAFGWSSSSHDSHRSTITQGTNFSEDSAGDAADGKDGTRRLPFFVIAERLEDSIQALRDEHGAVARRLDAQAEESSALEETLESAREQLRRKTAAIDSLVKEQAIIRGDLERTREMAAKWELRCASKTTPL